MKLVLIFFAVLHVLNGQRILFSPLIPGPEALAQIPIKEVEASGCDHTQMKNCQTAFNNFLSIQSDADFHNAQTLVDEVNRVLNLGVDDGLLKVCRARSLFYQCLGSRYSNCVSRFHFLGEGVDPANAAAFVQIFNELEFACNGGLLQSIQKWDCIRQNAQTAEQALKNCRASYDAATKTNASATCAAAEAMMLCYRAPYYLNCGEDVAWWSCEQGRVALNFDDYCPHLTCSYDTFAPKSAAAEMDYSGKRVARSVHQEPVFRTRRELFRSPNPQFMSPEKMNLFIQLGAKAAERERRRKRSLGEEEE